MCAEGSIKRIVVKFGGKSLDRGDHIRGAAKAVAKEVKRGYEVAVVVSAMGETTDHLLNVVKSASRGSTPTKELDDILSMGERISARIFASTLISLGVRASYIDPADKNWPIITDERFSNANPIVKECDRRVKRRIAPLLKEGMVPVIPGFVGRSRKGRITTLGRGGSDATAMLISRSLGARETVLVTDVDGIMTADPRLVDNPHLIERISVKELIGLANTGKKFIHGKALRYKDRSIDVKITNRKLGRIDNPGTVIEGSFPVLEVRLAEKKPVMAITFVGKAMMESPEIIMEITSKLRERGALILGLSANRDSVTTYLLSKDKDLLQSLHKVVLNHKEALAMAVRENLAFIKIKGVGLEEMPGIIGRIGSPLREHNINIFDMFTIASSILVFVNWEDRKEALRLLKQSLRRSPR